MYLPLVMNPSLLLRCILLLAVIVPGPLVFAQSASTPNTEYTITKRLLSIEDGLASHEVFCGLQDQSGFMWFGTRNGLNRYDGKNCLLFTRQRNNLQDNKVVQLARDDANRLFIEYGSNGFQLTTNGKVDVMNTLTQEVSTLTAAFPNLPFKEQDVYWISNDGSDQISLLTAHPFQLWKYSSKKGFQLRYQFPDWDKQDTVSFVDYRNTGPLCLFARHKALVKLFTQWTQYLISDDTVIAFTQKDALRSMPLGFTSQNDLLITYNTAAQINPFTVGAVTPTGECFFPARIKQDSVQSKYWYQVSCAANGSSSILYIPTEALYLWQENSFEKVVARSEIRSFENLFLYRLFPDNFGYLWLCTSLGVFQLKIEKNKFKQYFSSRQQSVEKNSQTRGIYADGAGRVASNVWMHTFLQQGGATKSTGDEQIKYALVNHSSSLYAGGLSLFRYDKKKSTLLNCPGGDGSEIWSMLSLDDSLLLLGRTNGFLLYNSNSSTFDSLRYVSRNTSEAKFVYRIFRDRTDTIWAVAENGLYKISHSGKFIEKYQAQFIDKLILLDAYADSAGIFWLATNGEGLYRWDRKANTFQQFNIASGFPSDVLYRIEEDGYNNLWISTDYGLARFNKKTFSIKTYTVADGISHNEFNRTSSFKAQDGQLYFGGLDGVNAFDPKNFITDTTSLNVPLRVISLNQFVGSQNKLVDKTSELLATSKITLAPSDQFFTLEFRLLDFAKEEAHSYAYRIEGIDKGWNYIDENSIRISGLPYGVFTLLVKAQDREGAWSKSELSIQLHVLRPFYLTWWFICLVVLLFAVAVYSIIKLRTKQLAAEKNKLELTVNERTIQLKRSLSEQAELLIEKDILIKEIHHRVKNNLQVISSLLELQSKNLSDEGAKEALLEGRRRIRSIALIHQNLYQIESLSSIELKRFVDDLCRQVEGIYKKQNDIVMNVNVPDLYLDIDTAIALGMIMNELLSNSFKYAFNEDNAGEIDLGIRPVAEGRYELLYSDNGPGLPADFDPNRATTLGIQLISDLSRQIGGKMRYEYKNGASFIITFTTRDFRKNQD